MSSPIRPVHTTVPGRARFRIADLLFNERLTTRMERQLGRLEIVTFVRGNSTNGSLLLFFDPGLDLWKLIAAIESVLNHPQAQQADTQTVQNPGAEVQTNPGAIQSRPPVQGWHRSSAEKSLTYLETSQTKGLSEGSALQRLQIHGPNTLPEPSPRSRWGMFKDQFLSLPVALLGAAAGLSLVTGGLIDAVVISGVIVVNSVIGYATESESEKAIASLQNISPPPVRIIRNNKRIKKSIAELVPGDLLLLQPGTAIGADARIIQAENLTVDESSLTGESLPVDKTSKALKKKALPLAEQSNMAFRGTVVTGGHGLAVVVATGLETQIGRLQEDLLSAERPRPPIEKKLAQTGDHLVVLWCGVCAAVFLLGLIRGFSLWNMLGLSVSLAAAAVPEGLPASATTTFALGMKKMRRHGIVVRQLQAVETLGSVQTICIDKTGTITQNKMEVQELFIGGQTISRQGTALYSGENRISPMERDELRQILTVGSLCSQVKINGNGSNKPDLEGSSTENALVQLAMDLGLDVKGIRKDHELLEVNHRSQRLQIMSTLHAAPEEGYLHAAKGSPLEVLELCEQQLQDGRLLPLTQTDRNAIIEANTRMAGKAYRVLGAATRSLSNPKDLNRKNGFIWLGLIGMTDPLRQGVQEAIQAFHRSGIETVMITGDQRLTAETVARQLDLSHGRPLEVMDATEMEALSPDEFQARAASVHVFSRVSPAHKLKIVQALQNQGRIVAMTGDGINDGPALKAAEVGIAMGEGGTDIARDVADVVLEHDHLDSLIQAVCDGRTTYTNIRKSVHFFLSTNFSETMLMTGSIAAGVGSPLTSMQLLWINLISDIFPGLSLSLEPEDADVLDQQPRDPKAPIFGTDDYASMARESGVITANALGAYGYGLVRYGAGLQAGSLAFHSLTLSQLLHAYSCRSSHRRAAQENGRPSNPWLHAAVGGSIGLHLLTMCIPGLRSFLNLTPLRLSDFGVIAGSTLASFGMNELFKPSTSRHACESR